MRYGQYAAFQARLLPTVDPDRIIGVRTPELRRFAKQLSRDEGAYEFLSDLPHQYFDENQLHAFVISCNPDFEASLSAVEAFLPYVDNWATCDQLSPKAFRREPEKLLRPIRNWLRSDHTYTIRFGLGMLMQHFLDERFRPEYAELAGELRSEEYYVRMMVAWFFATGLAKQYESFLPYLENRRLDTWTHNKAIQKSIESLRLTDSQKQALRALKTVSGCKRALSQRA